MDESLPVLADNRQLAETVIERCRKLASYSEKAGSTRRTFLSPPMHDVHRELRAWLEPFGANVKIDAAGNLRALYPAAEASAPRLLIGSHLDTVPEAGAYDGILGVVLGVALLEALSGRKLPYAVEIVGFSEEEGVRFGVPFIGSRALVGRLDRELLDARDTQRISVREAIESFGLDPLKMEDARLSQDAAAYIEFHIEQGPVLEKLGLPLAAVEAIAGQSRVELTFVGLANHAGTTPMNSRYDALTGAAEWIVAVERKANEIAGLTATVGSVQVKPGASNVIAGEAWLTLDVRHRDDTTRIQAIDDLLRHAQRIAEHRSLRLHCRERMNQPSTAMDFSLCGQIERAIRRTGCEPHRMASGAGHDAMILAEKIPAAMIFLRTPGGISHDPAESVLAEDVEKAIACGLYLLDQLADLPAFQTRTCRA
jgi:allantoate deiminase